MVDRIKAIRKALNMSQDEFANNLGLRSRGKIANIELGKVAPDDTFIKLICTTYKVNYQWIVNGIGEMFYDDDSDAQAIVDSLMTGDNEFAKSVLVKFARLSEEHWRQLKEIMEAMMQE